MGIKTPFYIFSFITITRKWSREYFLFYINKHLSEQDEVYKLPQTLANKWLKDPNLTMKKLAELLDARVESEVLKKVIVAKKYELDMLNGGKDLLSYLFSGFGVHPFLFFGGIVGALGFSIYYRSYFYEIYGKLMNTAGTARDVSKVLNSINPSNKETNDRITQLQQQIAALNESLQTVNNVLNAEASADRLPPEVIGVLSGFGKRLLSGVAHNLERDATYKLLESEVKPTGDSNMLSTTKNGTDDAKDELDLS